MTSRLVRVVTASIAVAWLAASGPAVPARAEPGAAQQSFASPEAAFAALVDAARAGDESRLLAILGPLAKPILESGDPVADRAALEQFVASYDEAHATQKQDDGEVELVTGKDEWPMPIPVVKDAGGWRFDTDAGDEEVLARRIGRNELFTIQACLAFVDAEREYWERNPEGAALLHYARQLLSSEGRRNGLYYPTGEGEEPSPLGPAFAKARAAGYGDLKAGKPRPFHGYYYRILTAQGRHAPGGAYDYLVDDQMIGGFALIAYPATWDNSGVMTFIVNQDGIVYQKDLGPETAQRAQAIERYDPEEGWSRVTEKDL